MAAESTGRMANSNNNSNNTSTGNSDAKTKDTVEEPLYDPRSLQYVEPTQTSLQCSVCQEYFIEPVSAPCGHTFCRACILQALDVSSGCPLCRTTIDPSALYEVIALSRICDELLVYCPHKALGCHNTSQRIQIGQHLKDDCVYIGTLCRVEECRKKLLKKDLSEHMESCPYKRVDCLMCNAKVQKSELSEHHKTCPAESVTCPHCETTRTRRRHLEHIQQCPKQILPCTLSEFGCPWKGPRFDLEAIHIPQCPYEAIRGYLELSKARMETLEQENHQLRSSFHDLKPQVIQLRDQVGEMAESLQLLTQQDQQQVAAINGGHFFGPSPGMMGFVDMNYQQYHHNSPQALDRRESYDMIRMDGGGGTEIRGMTRNNSIDGLGPGIPNNGGPLAGATVTADTQEFLISENERMRSEIETLTAGLASLELKQNMAIMTESMRMQEEIQSLRAACHGLRMQMHYLLLEQQQIRHHPPGPPPPGSSGGANGSGGPANTNGGRPLSTSGPPRPRFSDGLGRQETKL